MQFIHLENRKIMITGASSGIGRATAILASELGASVVLCARSEQRLKETYNMLKDQYKHQYIVLDVTDYDQLEDAFAKAVSDGTKLNGFVHCAGIAKPVPLRMLTPASVMDIMNVNFHSFLYLMNFYAKKKYSCGGSIVAVSAANCHYPQKCMSVYAASKAALEASVKTLALELIQQHIRINCVIPGAVETPMMQMTDETALNNILEKQLLGVGKPDDIASMIIYLLSDAASFITGRSLYVDGGMLGQ